MLFMLKFTCNSSPNGTTNLQYPPFSGRSCAYMLKQSSVPRILAPTAETCGLSETATKPDNSYDAPTPANLGAGQAI